MQRPSVLIIEDSETLARTYSEYLRNEPYNVTTVGTGQEALAFINQNTPQAIILDLFLPDMNGMEILKHVQKEKMPTSVIVNTADDSVDVAVEAMRHGSFDFIVKPFNANRFKVTVLNAIEHQRLSQIAEVFEEDFARENFCKFIGSSLAMQRTYRIIESAAPSIASVFIMGESGTGKELCAEAIHQLSSRSENAFITLNAAAIPTDLLESEIFGHVKGAFTGASSERFGAASRADKGCLFLDEICEMNYDLQSKLLRFIQSNTFQKVGGNSLEKVDVRFICATNRDIHKEVREGRFREDLFYRLHVIPINLPPLRDRENDILTIANKFLQDFAREENKVFTHFTPEVELIFRTYNWPGNVRQLQNIVRNIVVLNSGNIVTHAMLPPPLDEIELHPDSLPLPISTPVPPPREFQPQVSIVETPTPEINTPSDVNPILEVRPLWIIERDAIEDAIDKCGGNIPKAAALLDISASTIYRKRQCWKDNHRA